MRLLFFFILLTLSASPGYTADWNQWRGSERDGSIQRDTPLPDSLGDDTLTAAWATELSEGYSSPVVADIGSLTGAPPKRCEALQTSDQKHIPGDANVSPGGIVSNFVAVEDGECGRIGVEQNQLAFLIQREDPLVLVNH